MTLGASRRGLHRLLYFSAFSSAFPSDGPTQDEEVGKIIRASIRNNRAVNVTGLLLVHQTWFVQALEGPHEAVMTTYGRILADTRHEESRIVVAAPAKERLFGDWNMCARRVSNADDAILGALDGKGVFEPQRLTAVTGLHLLTTIRDIQARTLVAGLG